MWIRSHEMVPYSTGFTSARYARPRGQSFLTGRYHLRGGVHGVSTGAERLNLDETTIADVLKAAGYATGAYGKWHKWHATSLSSERTGI